MVLELRCLGFRDSGDHPVIIFLVAGNLVLTSTTVLLDLHSVDVR